MKKRIMYIEHKTHQNDMGKAWIGLVDFDKLDSKKYEAVDISNTDRKK